MFALKVIMILCILREGRCNWISDWMLPIQSQLQTKSLRRDSKIFSAEDTNFPQNPPSNSYNDNNEDEQRDDNKVQKGINFDNPINSIDTTFQKLVNKNFKGFEDSKKNEPFRSVPIESDLMKDFQQLLPNRGSMANDVELIGNFGTNIGNHRNNGFTGDFTGRADDTENNNGGLSDHIVSRNNGFDQGGQDWTGAGGIGNIPQNQNPVGESSITRLKRKLEQTLQNANQVIQGIKSQIQIVAQRESTLKNAIFYGRQGVTVVTISSLNQKSRQYVVQDGIWTLCNGILQRPFSGKQAPETPHCTGRWLSSDRDPCAFNSMIKYETIPTSRAEEYVEDEFLCLKPSFNNTMEQYLSVPRRIVNQTCTEGLVRSLEDNIKQCGNRVMADYTFYPYKESQTVATLPIEYCTEPGGTCKLIVAWHQLKGTVEHFEFLKDEEQFKEFFIRTNTSLY